MRCFVHHDHEAVGICRACGKGLCPDCAVDLGHSISCKGACEQKAKEMHAQNIRSQTILNAQRRNRFLAPVLFLFIGVITVVLGFQLPGSFNVGTVAGAGFIVFALVLFAVQQRLFKNIDRNLSN